MIELCRGLTELKEELSDLRGQVNKMNPICDAFNTVRRMELRSAAGISVPRNQVIWLIVQSIKRDKPINQLNPQLAN
jgi:hypothetical protein